MSEHQLSRRSLLRSSGGAVALATVGSAAAACSKSGNANTATKNEQVRLPKYIPYTGARPDLPGNTVGLPQGFLHYPDHPTVATHSVPGKGGSVSAFVIGDNVPIRLSQNKFWQALNSKLDVQLKMQITPRSDFVSKAATVIAGNDLPDVFQMATVPAHMPELLAKDFTDISEFVSGDAVKQYPFLAALGDAAWRTTVFNGGIYGVPNPRETIGNILYRRDDILRNMGLNPQPESYAEWKQLLQEVTDAKHNKWAMASVSGAQSFIQEMLGLPNNWQVKNGTFTATQEMPEFMDALGYTRDLVKSEVFHPDSLSTAVNPPDLFGGGTTPFMWDNYTGWVSRVTLYPSNDVNGMLPPNFDSGHKAAIAQGTPSYSFVAFKKASKSRIKELLRLCNWLASPFGTKEHLFVDYGIPHVDYTLNGTDPVLTRRGKAETVLNATYIAAPHSPLYFPGKPEATANEYEYAKKAVSIGIPDPSIGLFSNTNATTGASLGTALSAAQTDIWKGRKPVSSWKDTMKTWRREGGDQIRKEYEESYKKSHR